MVDTVLNIVSNIFRLGSGLLIEFGAVMPAGKGSKLKVYLKVLGEFSIFFRG